MVRQESTYGPRYVQSARCRRETIFYIISRERYVYCDKYTISGEKSVHFQVELPSLFALDASKCAIRVLLGGQTICGHMNRELAIIVHKHGKTLDCLTPRPQTVREDNLGSNPPA
jgi:hypothetical protein